jgi:hypothetical protein
MNHSTSNTLIVMGGLLALAPYVSGYFHEGNVVRLLARPGAENVYLPPGMNNGPYQWVCFFLGAAMIGVAVRLWRREAAEPARVAEGG